MMVIDGGNMERKWSRTAPIQGIYILIIIMKYHMVNL
jgi:hypothetical protein